MNKEILRKCIVTNKIVNVEKLIRIVKVKDNQFIFDIDKTIPGRGAYILDESDIIEQAFQKKLLNKTFKSNIINDVYDKLKQEVKNYEKTKNQK